MGFLDFFKKKKTSVKVEMASHEYTYDELETQREEKVRRIRELAETSIPSKNGLRPHEIIMLSHASRYKTQGNVFPQYWHYEYAVDDPQKLLDMLCSRGFIQIKTATESVPELTVVQLKEICSEYGLSQSGKKTDLVQTILAALDEPVLYEKIPIRKYKLTTLGEQELKENSHIVNFKSNAGYGTIWDINRAGYQNERQVQDGVWGNLNAREYEAHIELSHSGDYFKYYKHRVNLCLDQSKFLIKENRNLDTALSLLAESFYYLFKVITVASCKNDWKTKKLEAEPRMKRIKDAKTGNWVLVEDTSDQMFYDMIFPCSYILEFKKIKENRAMSDDQLWHSLINIFNKLTVNYEHMGMYNITPLSITNDELAGMIVAETNNEHDLSFAFCQRMEKEIKMDKTPLYKK